MEVLGSKLVVGASTLVPLQHQQWRRKHSTHALTSWSPITLFTIRSSLRSGYRAASGQGQGQQPIKPIATIQTNSFYVINPQKFIASIQINSASKSKQAKPIASIQTNSSVQSNPQKPVVPIQRKSLSASNPQEGTTNPNLNPIEKLKKLARAGLLVITISFLSLNAQGMLFCRPARAAGYWYGFFDAVMWGLPRLSEFKEGVDQVLFKIAYANPKNAEEYKRILLESRRDADVDSVLEALDTLMHKELGGLVWTLVKPQIYASLGRLEEAKEGFKFHLTLREFNARALQGLAMVMHKQGEDAAMLEMLEECLQRALKKQLEREADNIKLLLAYAYVLQDNLEEALKQYQCLVDEKPKDFRPYLCQGILFTVLGKEKEAEEQFQKYRKLVPKDFPTHDFLDRVMMKAKIQGRKRYEERKKEEELLAQGKTYVRTMKQPNIGGVIQDLYETNRLDDNMENKILDVRDIRDLYENNTGEEIEDLPVFESNMYGDSKDSPESLSNIDGDSKVLPASESTKGKDIQDLSESERKG